MEGGGGKRGIFMTSFQDISMKTEQQLTGDHDGTESSRGEGGDDRSGLWLQTILHHNQTHKHQVTLHHLTVWVWRWGEGGGRCVGVGGGGQRFDRKVFNVYQAT